MEKGIKVYVGLDVHKDTIAIAVAEAGRTAGRVIGTLAHDVNKLLKALGKLGRPEDVARGVQVNKICVAVARELAGFIWAIGLAAAQPKPATN
jgi:hypothetical protein